MSQELVEDREGDFTTAWDDEDDDDDDDDDAS